MSKKFKLFAIVGSLSEKEVREVRKMLISPFFTRREHIKVLFDLLVKSAASSKSFPEPEALFYRVFPTLPFDYPKLRGLMSDLLELIEAYWLISSTRQDEVRSRLILSAIYRQRNLEKSYGTSIKKTNQLIDGLPIRNADYFQYLLDFQTDQMLYQSSTKKTENIFLQEMSDTEDILFLSKKMRTACAQLSHQLVQNTSYDVGLLSTILSEINQEKYLAIPAIAIYFYCFQFLTESNTDHYFQAFKTQLREHRSLFTKEELGAPYRLAINFCIRNSNEGNSAYIRELWELYINGMEQDILLVHNFIPRFTFNNAISVGLRLKEFDWAEQFISTASDRLEPTFREQTIIFNLAKVAFERKQYEQSLVYLQEADFRELRINIVGKIMMIKIYFELAAFESLHSHLDSFQQFIRRKEVSDYHRQNILNIIRFVKKINSLPAYDRAERKSIREQIAGEEILSERVWLLEKLG